jgi:hypothetical protein
MPILPQAFSPVALEVQAGRVEEHQLQFAELIKVTTEKLLFDEVLSAAQASRIVAVLDQLFSQPPHVKSLVLKMMMMLQTYLKS